ncbi:MAG: waaE [Chlorobi bacterium]|jgi:glycosyltransferase involved in cell wall biosynthesis|nr:waaE [Chlorobiota bacterium]
MSSDRPPSHGPSLSVCMVARNEEDTIQRALDSVSGWSDEIIVVDCESSDATVAIAQKCGAAVHSRPNHLTPEVNKNISFDLAHGEWLLCLDPDEVIPVELREEIVRIVAGNPPENGFKIPRRNFYFGVPLRHGGNYPDHQLRLFRRGKGRFPGRSHHERVEIDGAIGELSVPFDHFPYPTFEIWLRKFEFYTSFEASRLAARGVPITPRTIRHYMIVRPLRRWLERLFLKRGIRDGVPGVLAATFDLMNNVVSFGRYWMMTRDRS